ncbi:hypothetical protein CSPX01_10262 [Colletotrichum filicis]|nr:hypothetical protein CSPX01_10262 [Colletotrichum filicis]
MSSLSGRITREENNFPTRTELEGEETRASIQQHNRSKGLFFSSPDLQCSNFTLGGPLNLKDTIVRSHMASLSICLPCLVTGVCMGGLYGVCGVRCGRRRRGEEGRGSQPASLPAQRREAEEEQAPFEASRVQARYIPEASGRGGRVDERETSSSSLTGPSLPPIHLSRVKSFRGPLALVPGLLSCALSLFLSLSLSPRLFTSVLSSYSTSRLPFLFFFFFSVPRAAAGQNEREKERRGRDEPMSGVRASVGPSPQSTLMGTLDWVDPGYTNLRASESQRGWCIHACLSGRGGARRMPFANIEHCGPRNRPGTLESHTIQYTRHP